MNIVINTRLLGENYQTGVQNYITQLKHYLPKARPDDNYYWLDQTNLRYGLAGKVAFDHYLCKKQIRQRKADIFHSPHGPLPIGKKSCPYFSTIHDLGYLMLPQFGRRLDILYLKMVMRNILNQVDVLITDSVAVKEEILRFYGIPDSKIKVILPGIDQYFVERENEDYLTKLRAKHQLTNNKVIYSNSAHSPRKNIQALIDVFKQNYRDFKNTKLIISGGINLTYQPGNNIVLLPYVPKRTVRAFYQMADIFVYPSFYEGFGFPVLEAMASRCLVACSRIPCLNEINPDLKYAFDPHDRFEIYQAIKSGLEIGQTTKDQLFKDYAKTVSRYDWTQTAKKLSNLYHSR